MKNDIEMILVSEEQIRERCKELGAQISKEYKDKNPIFIALLKGSVPFMAELIKNVDIYCETEYMSVSSYVGNMSSGDVRINKDIDRSIQGMDVIIVEDIVDTGRTLKKVRELLRSKGAASIKTVTLLHKEAGRLEDVLPEYVGFEIDDYFVVGYGLDFNQLYRNLPYVGVLKEECYKR